MNILNLFYVALGLLLLYLSGRGLKKDFTKIKKEKHLGALRFVFYTVESLFFGGYGFFSLLLGILGFLFILKGVGVF